MDGFDCGSAVHSYVNQERPVSVNEVHAPLCGAIQLVNFPMSSHFRQKNPDQSSPGLAVQRTGWPSGYPQKIGRSRPRHYLELFNLFGLDGLVIDLRYEIAL